MKKTDQQKAREREVRAFLKRTPEENQRRLVLECLDAFPAHWREFASKKFEEMARGSQREAVAWITALVNQIKSRTELNISFTDHDIRDLAANLAWECRGYFAQQLEAFTPVNVKKNAHRLCEEECLRYGVRIPEEFSAMEKQARYTDSGWWLRGLRASFARAREAAAIGAGMVHAKAAVYCSEDTVIRRGQQLARNRELLEGVEMVALESGEVMNLGEIAKRGMANQENRRNELMTRINGFEEQARKRGEVCSFLTITCPSRMHSTKKDGTSNPKYDGTTPAEAQKYLCEVWARVRAAWARCGLRCYGLRIAEPHHDGTPHWHMVLFHRPETALSLMTHAEREFIRDSFTELERVGLRRYGEITSEYRWVDVSPRFKVVRINPKRGSAAGYVLKYVCKNIGGITGEDSDEAGASSESLAARVEAWAATWRIRQFQQIGGHFVSVWRELRRIEEPQAKQAGGAIFHGWQAAQRHGDIKASYSEFIEAMGGLETPPHEGRLKVLMECEQKQGKYGPALGRFLRGVEERFGMAHALGNRQHWQRA